MIHRYERQHETARDRARVAAELLEEARQLTETAMLADHPPASVRPLLDVPRSGNGHGRRAPTLASLLPSRSQAERALEALGAAIVAQPDSVSLLLERATQLGAMGRYSDARADLERALLLDPANVTVRSALGIVLLKKGLWASAVPHLRLVVEAESWSPTAWFYLGEALNHADDLDGALAAFGRAAELDPHHAKALYGQGVVLDRLHRHDDAARLYRRSREAAAK